MLHENELIIRKARCLAKKIIELSKSDKVSKCYELDDIIQEARYLEYETRELEESCDA